MRYLLSRGSMTITFLHTICLGLGLVIAPLFFMLSLWYKRQFKNIILEWKKNQLVIYTIIAFVLNLILFILTCFFFAGYLGRIEGLRLIEISPELMMHLSIDSLALLIGVTVAYFGIQNFYSQFVTTEGIHLKPNWASDALTVDHFITWSQVMDVYTQSDYPMTIYRFIIQLPDGSYTRKQLSVPFYALSHFEGLLKVHWEKKQPNLYTKARNPQSSSEDSLTSRY